MAAKDKAENEINLKTRDQILETAFLICIQKGFTSLSMNELLKRTGVTKGGFYYYFESKDELLAEIIKKYLISYYDEILPYILNYNGSPKEKLKMLFFAIPDTFSNYQQIVHLSVDNNAVDFRSFFLLLMDGVQKYKSIREYYKNLHIKVIEYIREIIEDGKEQGLISSDIDSVGMAKFIHASLQGTIFVGVMVRSMDMEELLYSNYNYVCKCMDLE